MISTVVLITACSSERQDAEQNAQADSNCPTDPPPFIDDGFPQPEFRHSENGVLETTLRAASGPVTLDGRPYVTQSYEGSVPGPMLVVCPGDRMLVNLENDLEEETNLHAHGFHVSPRDNSDNIFSTSSRANRSPTSSTSLKTIRLARTGIIRTTTSIRAGRCSRGWRVQ
jgi:hypothetical protein